MRTGIVMLFSICLLLVSPAYADTDWMQSFQDQKAKFLGLLDELYKKSSSSFEKVKKEIEEVYGSDHDKPKPVVEPVKVPGQKK